MEHTICEAFLLNLKWEDQFLILFFEVGRHTCNPEYLSRSPSPFLMWATPSAGSLHEDMEEGKACSVSAYSCSWYLSQTPAFLALNNDGSLTFIYECLRFMLGLFPAFS